MTRPFTRFVIGVAATALIASAAGAQPLGTFRWQLQPFCNVITVNVIQQGAVYTLDGYDDQCGAPQRAPLVGLATPNPDGTIGLGLNVVTVPGGRGIQIDARISLATLAGPWTDSAGNSGTFAFGVSSGGNPRPAATGGSTIPATFALLSDGGFLARGTLNTGTIPATGAGTRMMWFPNKAAFRAGTVLGDQWDDANIGTASTAIGAGTLARGNFSVAMGSGTVAIGEHSSAVGFATVASGSYSTALGRMTVASGPHSTATGHLTDAIGDASTAMGFNTTASGLHSTATGSLTTASGVYSTAMGSLTTASGPNSTAIGTSLSAAGQGSVVMGVRAAATATANGSFVFGDRSTGTTGQIITSISPNQFLVRAVGGVAFFTSSDQTAGLQLAAGGSQWLTVSDVNRKHAFASLDGESVLDELSRMPLMSWSYKSQDAAIRHVGPTAQDFHAAFGLGEDPLRIGTLDADGIALAGVKALEARTRALRDEYGALKEALADLRRELAELKMRR